MRVRTLGALAGAPTDLPSSQSVLSVIRGEPGGWGKVLLSTALRTLLIVPGMWFAGGKGWKLWAGAGVSSVSITVFLFFWYAAQENGRVSVAEDVSTGGALPSGSGTTVEDVGVSSPLGGVFRRPRRA